MNAWKRRVYLTGGTIEVLLLCNPWLARQVGLLWAICLLGIAFCLHWAHPPMPTKRIQTLRNGTDDLCVFLISATLQGIVFVLFLLFPQGKTVSPLSIGIYAVLCAGVLAAVFWGSMIRVYITSVQLGMKHRVLAALCGWIPGVNLWYLTKIIRICNAEVKFETEKWELGNL